jgi:hypothetical protein
MLKKEDYKKKKEPWRHKFKNNKASKYYARRVRVKRRTVSLTGKMILKVKENKSSTKLMLFIYK